MLSKKQKRQVRLLYRQHAKMEEWGMKVSSYHAFHGMNAFVGEEWRFAAEQDAIPAVFTEKFSRLSDQHSETCWSDVPIGPFGLMGEVDGLRSPIDLWSRPITGCDQRVNGLRTVRPSRLNLALKILKGEENAFGHSEIIVHKTQNSMFWVKKQNRAFYDSIAYLDGLNEVVESDDDAERVIKARAYRRLLGNIDCIDCVNDNDVINAVIEQAELNGLEVITIDDEGNVVTSSISSIEEVEEVLEGYYYPYTIEETVEEIKADLFNEFLNDGSNERFVSICCPAWVAKEAETIYDEIAKYRQNMYFDHSRREVIEDFSARIWYMLNYMNEYAKKSIHSVFDIINKTTRLFDEMVEEAEEMEEDEDYLPF